MDTTTESQETIQVMDDTSMNLNGTSQEEENLDPQQQQTQTTSQQASKKRKRSKPHSIQKLCQDSITVWIPLDVTADLRLAVKRTRQKRIEGIYEKFPSLNKKKNGAATTASGGEDSNLNEDDEAEDETSSSKAGAGKDGKEKSANAAGGKKKKKQAPAAHAPQPSQYGSVVDYLEAKYVRGVNYDDEEEAGEDGSEEGAGSVYSGNSFLDDGDLQRDVAEQFMANKTLTKLELEEDDAEFFVNVGNLEVEDNEYGENYDPLQDKEETTTTKKRKKNGDGAGNKKTKADSSVLNKSTKSNASTVKSNATKASTSKGGAGKKNADSKASKANAKKEWETMHKMIIAQIQKMTDEDLPKRKTKRKVALTCPQNKKPGDEITFANPHNPGQRLRVKIPADTFPGNTFKVSVPVKESDADDDDGKDHNKFSREFQEAVGDYATAYDDWCQAQRQADPKFPLAKTKDEKFDKIISAFPRNLVTSIDREYMKKVMRRGRQNKRKREAREAEAVKKEINDETEATKDDKDDDENETDAEDDAGSTSNKSRAVKGAKGGRKVHLPTMGTEYPIVTFDAGDFAQ